MESTRIQVVNGEPVIEETETRTFKRHIRESDLLRRKAYFEGMIEKGQAGLARVEAHLTQIQNAKE
jgi:hypothetical protein